MLPASAGAAAAKVLVCYFWYFWLGIQNTANRHVSNAFDLIGVFISFPLVRAAARRPTPAPLFGVGKYQKKKIAFSVGVGAWTCLRRRGRGGRGV